ncbi:MAG: M15 family metallopeptidase [Spirochaetota bacterium]|nr:M15 family metallopeptidase [Spirochaetota bacterium]
MKITILPIIVTIFLAYNNGLSEYKVNNSKSSKRSIDQLKNNADYINLNTFEGVFINLKYATKDNFMGENLYGDFNQCYLHRIAANKLKNAVKYLQKDKPGFKFLLFDCLRPRSVQYKMWNRVKGTSNQSYVANPHRGSIHNYGLAIDLSLINENGEELDMGTPYDTFSKLSEPRMEKHFLKLGKLNQNQYKNRLILRNAMIKAGFKQLPNEWWHFDALSGKNVREKFKIVE